MLGNGRAECYCYDGVTRLGHIRGKMRKKVWVSAGDIVLVGKRDYQDDKVSNFFAWFTCYMESLSSCSKSRYKHSKIDGFLDTVCVLAVVQILTRNMVYQSEQLIQVACTRCGVLVVAPDVITYEHVCKPFEAFFSRANLAHLQIFLLICFHVLLAG